MRSDDFKQLASQTEHQFMTLFRATHLHIITGVKVTKARPGSVILNLLIVHSPEATPEEVVSGFKEAVAVEASVSRMVNVLKLRKDTDVEFSDVNTKDKDETKMSLLLGVSIGVGALLLLGIIIGGVVGVVLYRRKHMKKPM